MKQISIIFSKHSGFNIFSALIMAATKASFSHAAVKITDEETGKVEYWQASNLSVNIVSEEMFLSEETIVFQKNVTLSNEDFIKGKSFLEQSLGKPYSMPMIFGFALTLLASMVGIKINNPAKADGSQWVCSTLVAAFVNFADNQNLVLNDMTPAALYAAVQTLPDTWQ